MSTKYFIFFSLLSLLFSCDNNDDPVIDTNVTDPILSEINKLRITGCKCGDEDKIGRAHV